MLTVDYVTDWGERARLAIYSSRYAEGGALALDLTSPEGEDYFDLWCSLTINLSGGPFASIRRVRWCRGNPQLARGGVGHRGLSATDDSF